jgi:hypothetical protein
MRARQERPGLLDVVHIIAAQSTAHIPLLTRSNKGRRAATVMSYPHEVARFLELCRNVDERALQILCQHSHGDWMILKTRITHAACIGDCKRIEELLAHGAPVDFGASALAHAVCCGQDAAARLLLAAGSSPQCCMEEFRGLHIFGECGGHCDTVFHGKLSAPSVLARRALVAELCAMPAAKVTAIQAFELGLDLSIPSLVSRHVHEVAAHWGSDDSVVDTEVVDSWFEEDWSGPERREILRMLAVQPTFCDVYFGTHWFYVAARIKDVSFFRDMCALYPEHDASEVLFGACGVGDLDRVKLLLTLNPAVHSCFAGTAGSSFGPHPSVIVAAQHGHVDVVRYVLPWLCGKKLQSRKRHALMAAVGCGLLAEATELIRSGVDVNAPVTGLSTQDAHDSYLSVACDCADVEMVRMLLLARVNPKPCDATFYNPLLRAAILERAERNWAPPPSLPAADEARCRERIVDLLLAAGATTEGGCVTAEEAGTARLKTDACAFVASVRASRGSRAAVAKAVGAAAAVAVRRS